MSQRDTDIAYLEQSVQDLSIQSETRIAQLTAEKNSAVAKCSQLEILLRGRQQALMNKEIELQKLSRKPTTSTIERSECVISYPPKLALEWANTVHANLRPTRNELSQTTFLVAVTEREDPRIFESFDGTRRRGGSPKTAVRRRDITRDPSSSDDSPVRIIRRPETNRISITTRSSFATVRSSSSDSDTSLDRLVSSTMRLSRTSLVRMSGSVRESRDSVNNFPKKWK
jgi:hypothetical protein